MILLTHRGKVLTIVGNRSQILTGMQHEDSTIILFPLEIACEGQAYPIQGSKLRLDLEIEDSKPNGTLQNNSTSSRSRGEVRLFDRIATPPHLIAAPKAYLYSPFPFLK